MQGRTKIVRDLTSGNVTWTMITFSMPLLMSSLLQILYNITDMVIVGRFVGKEGLGAVSIGTDVLHFLCFAALGFSNAGQVIISQLIGAGYRERMRHTIGTLFSFMGGASIVLSAIGLKIGNVFGLRYKSRAEIAGGAILILMGTKILLEHLGVIAF